MKLKKCTKNPRLIQTKDFEKKMSETFNREFKY